MIPLDVQLNGDDCWPDLAQRKFIEADLTGVALLPAGTVSGMPSVTVRIDMPDGSTVLAQTTARLFCLAARMFMAKHPDLFDD
jgi:hypothetical protein